MNFELAISKVPLSMKQKFRRVVQDLYTALKEPEGTDFFTLMVNLLNDTWV
jgi:hypothetical protein